MDTALTHLARCAQQHSRMTIIGITYLSLPVSEACSTEGTHACYCKPTQKLISGKAVGGGRVAGGWVGVGIYYLLFS